MLLKIISYTFPLIIVLSMLFGAQTTFAMDKKMQKVHNSVVQDYESVEHLTAAQFKELDTEQTIVFDVREQFEFKVSHIANAIQINPDIKTPQFIEKYAEQYIGKTIVFYCSVGVRSSKLASRLNESLNSTKIYNLTGGIFDWHNNKSPLNNEHGITELIHPYNRKWGKYIIEKDSISYK